VLKEAAELRPVVPVGEPGPEPPRVEPAGAGAALVDAADEDDLAVLIEQVDNLVVVALVQVVPVSVLQPPDGELVLDHAEPLLKRCDPVLCRQCDLLVS
jgi:hypothetical protein